MVHVCALVSACIRSCDNGGTLVEGSCTCDCAGGFNGTNCKGECIVYKEANPRDSCTLNLNSLKLSINA